MKNKIAIALYVGFASGIVSALITDAVRDSSGIVMFISTVIIILVVSLMFAVIEVIFS